MYQPSIIIAQLRENVNDEDFNDGYDNYCRNQHKLNHLKILQCVLILVY